MSNLEMLTGRNYLSFSSMSTYADCSERFYLERIVRVPQGGAWWFVAGHALHKAAENLDRGIVLSPELAWADAWREELQHIEDQSALRAGGRATKEWPNKENGDFWQANGLKMIQDYVKWRDIKFAAGWQWVMFDDKPMIEVPVEGHLGPVVKGVVDRIMVSPDGDVHVVDLKSSSREPNSLQLSVYRWLIEDTIGISPSYGSYYMFRKGSTTETKPLTHSRDWLASWFSSTARAIEGQIYIPNVGMLCSSCGVREYCSAMGNPSLISSISNVSLQQTAQ